jgi:hypothetical protein
MAEMPTIALRSGVHRRMGDSDRCIVITSGPTIVPPALDGLTQRE